MKEGALRNLAVNIEGYGFLRSSQFTQLWYILLIQFINREREKADV